jgi:hypothetical protein
MRNRSEKVNFHQQQSAMTETSKDNPDDTVSPEYTTLDDDDTPQEAKDITTKTISIDDKELMQESE